MAARKNGSRNGSHNGSRNGSSGGRHPKKDSTAIERLAKTVNAGFRSLRSEISDLGKGLRNEMAASEKRLSTQFNARFDNLNEQVGARLAEHDSRLEKLESKP